MSDERHRKISERAYRLWETEGQPAGRDLEHWVRAEREEADADPSQANEGEGNRTAARAYNRKAKQFAATGPVKAQARKAAADLDGPEAGALREAELVGKRHARGEDPAVKRTK